MSKTKKEAVDEVCDIFVEMYNELYYERYDAPIGRDKVDFHHLKSFDGRCGHHDYKIYFGIHIPRWMQIWSVEKKLTLLLHELAHIEETSHKPCFYDQYIELFQKGDEDFFESTFDEEIDMKKVKKKISKNPSPFQVDHRIDNVAKRRKYIHNKMNVEYSFEELFTNIYTTRYSKWNSNNHPVMGSKSHETIEINKINVDGMVSKDDCINNFHKLNGIMARSNYKIKPIEIDNNSKKPEEDYIKTAKVIKRLHKEGVIPEDKIRCKKV